MLFRVQRSAFAAGDALCRKPQLAKSPLGCLDSLIRISNWNRRAVGEGGAEVRFRPAVRSCIKPPRVRPALKRSKDDAETDQREEGQEPPGVEHIRQPDAIQQCECRWGVGSLQLSGFARRPLHYQGPGG